MIEPGYSEWITSLAWGMFQRLESLAYLETHQHKIHDGLQVSGRAKVLVVAPRKAGADTVVVVHHACNTVEPETVKLVLVHPEAQVTEQEAKDLVVPVVEQSAVLNLMASTSALVEVQVVRSIEEIETVKHVLAGMRMDHVEKNGDTHAVRGVDQLLQFLGGTVTGARSKKARDMVSERYCGR